MEEATDCRCGIPMHVLEVMAGDMVRDRKTWDSDNLKQSKRTRRKPRGGGHLYVESSQVETLQRSAIKLPASSHVS